MQPLRRTSPCGPSFLPPIDIPEGSTIASEPLLITMMQNFAREIKVEIILIVVFLLHGST